MKNSKEGACFNKIADREPVTLLKYQYFYKC